MLSRLEHEARRTVACVDDENHASAVHFATSRDSPSDVTRRGIFVAGERSNTGGEAGISLL
jgi:hypothetical protein